MDIPKQDVRATQRVMISDCLMRDKKLSDWEKEFIRSIDVQFEAGKFLSDKQELRLEDIWEKVTK